MVLFFFFFGDVSSLLKFPHLVIYLFEHRNHKYSIGHLWNVQNKSITVGLLVWKRASKYMRTTLLPGTLGNSNSILKTILQFYIFSFYPLLWHSPLLVLCDRWNCSCASSFLGEFRSTFEYGSLGWLVISHLWCAQEKLCFCILSCCYHVSDVLR